VQRRSLEPCLPLNVILLSVVTKTPCVATAPCVAALLCVDRRGPKIRDGNGYPMSVRKVVPTLTSNER
jgi:hypothetical protein